MYDEDHGHGLLKECFWAIIIEYEDGYIQCPLNGTEMKCEDCIKAWETLVHE